MTTTLGRVIILVNDYDKAFSFYEENFLCKKLYDKTTKDGQRFLHVGFSEDENIGIWFLKADNNEQKSKIGKQTGGQPTLVIYTNNCKEIYERLIRDSVTIIEELIETQGSKFFHCLDLYGNRLTVVELIKI